MPRQACAISFFVLALTSCTYITEIGRPIDPARVAAIERGKTTAAQVLAMFDAPTQRGAVSGNQGEEEWIYLHELLRTPWFGETTLRVKSLSLFLRDGVVLHFVANDAAPSYRFYREQRISASAPEDRGKSARE